MTRATAPELAGALRQRLRTTRERTLDLVEPLQDHDVLTQHEPTQSPIVWDLGHIANFQERWLLQELGRRGLHPEANDTYDATQHPRPTRHALDLPDRTQALRYLQEALDGSLQAVTPELLQRDDPLLADGFLVTMVDQHEAQHQETICTTLQQVPHGRYVPKHRHPTPPARADVTGWAHVPQGTFPMGNPPYTPGTWDNEWPRHDVDVDTFWIQRAPVTNGDYLAFMDDGGYEREELWSEDGWVLRTVQGWEHPKYWHRSDDGTWHVRWFDRERPLPRNEPVSFVSWWEAEAYANWAGARLPTEAEWEKAATWDPTEERKRTYPWGDEAWSPDLANLDQRTWTTAPVGAYPDGASAYDVHQLAGDVWEWTATEHHAYPGFEPFAYEDYSAPNMDRGFLVLKGGSWATRPGIARGAFRNWTSPEQRHWFAGFRLATSEPPQGEPPA